MTKEQDREDIERASKEFTGKTGKPYSSDEKHRMNAKGRRDTRKLQQSGEYKFNNDPRGAYRIKTSKSFD